MTWYSALTKLLMFLSFWFVAPEIIGEARLRAHLTRGLSAFSAVVSSIAWLVALILVVWGVLWAYKTAMDEVRQLARAKVAAIEAQHPKSEVQRQKDTAPEQRGDGEAAVPAGVKPGDLSKSFKEIVEENNKLIKKGHEQLMKSLEDEKRRKAEEFDRQVKILFVTIGPCLAAAAFAGRLTRNATERLVVRPVLDRLAEDSTLRRRLVILGAVMFTAGSMLDFFGGSSK